MTFLHRLFHMYQRIALAGALGVCVAVAHAAPFLPSSDATVLERLPFRAGDTTARELAALRRANLQTPQDAALAIRLANRYFELAMERGDPRYVGYADAVLQQLSAPLPAQALLVRAKLRQYRHGFSEGLADFAAALALDPDLAEAHSWRGAILMVQARYAQAGDECQALERLGRTTLALGCSGLLAAYTGDLAGAGARLQRALAATTDPGNRQWLLTRMAEVATWAAQLDAAERHFQSALALGRDDTYLLAARADFLLDAARWRDVVTLLAPWEQVDTLLLRLALAEQQLGLPQALAHGQTLGERFDAARQRGDTTHQTEEARYFLLVQKDTTTALRLALANFEVQREPRDARIVLEASLAARKPQAAEPVLAWLAANGFTGAPLRSLADQVTALGRARAAP
jgi:Tfp pilus assembly protein PilF